MHINPSEKGNERSFGKSFLSLLESRPGVRQEKPFKRRSGNGTKGWSLRYLHSSEAPQFLSSFWRSAQHQLLYLKYKLGECGREERE